MAEIGKPLKRHQVIPLHQPITAPEPQAKPLPAPSVKPAQPAPEKV